MASRGKLKHEVELQDCLTDKSYAAYQRVPDFAEIVASVNKFGKLFKLGAFGFAALEQALDYESANVGFDKCAWTRSTFLNNLYMELLANFGRSFKEFDGCEVNDAIFSLMKRWDSAKTLPIDSEILSATDMCEFSAVQKLCVIRTFLNAIFYTERVQHALETWEADDLRVVPFVIDDSGNKLWYFGDTYLFLESSESLKNDDGRSPTKKRTTKSQRELDASGATTFVGGAFALICRSSEDWRRLIDAYRATNQWELAIKLAEKCEHIRVIENARLKEELRNSATLRTSSRVQQKLEEKKRQEALEKQRKDEERRRREEEIKKLLEEKNQSTFEQKEAIDNLLANRREGDSAASREERRLQREQRRLQELAEREHRAMRRMSTTVEAEIVDQPDAAGTTVRQPYNGAIHHDGGTQADPNGGVKCQASRKIGFSTLPKVTPSPKRRGRPSKLESSSTSQISKTTETMSNERPQSWYELCNVNGTASQKNRAVARDETSLLDEYLRKPTSNMAKREEEVNKPNASNNFSNFVNGAQLGQPNRQSSLISEANEQTAISTSFQAAQRDCEPSSTTNSGVYFMNRNGQLQRVEHDKVSQAATNKLPAENSNSNVEIRREFDVPPLASPSKSDPHYFNVGPGGQFNHSVDPSTMEDIRNYGPLSYGSEDNSTRSNNGLASASCQRKPSIFNHSRSAGTTYYCYRNGSNSTVVGANGTSAILLPNTRQTQPTRYAVMSPTPRTITYAANRDHDYSRNGTDAARRPPPPVLQRSFHAPPHSQPQYRQIQPKPFANFHHVPNQSQTFPNPPNSCYYGNNYA